MQRMWGVKKVFSFMFLALTVFALLTACGGGGGSDGGGGNNDGGGGSAPSAPQNVQSTAGNGQVTISWDSVAGATSYNIYWNTTAGVTTSNNKIPGAVSPRNHTGLTNNTTYYYIVTAVNSVGESAVSSEVSATPLPLISVGLVAYYPFNGNANDESGNGNNGTVIGATLTTDRFGNANSAYSFDGNDRIDIPDDPTLTLSDQFTIASWAQFSAFGADGGYCRV